MRAVVAGGVGGLACAQGPARHGIDVTVIEPDTELHATGGYELHLGGDAVEALRELLPPARVKALPGSSVATRGFALVLRDHRGRRLLRATEPPGDLALDVDRITLRELLAKGLGERLLLGRRCVDWHEHTDGVTAVLDDGSTLDTDVLVIADGANSSLAQPLPPRPSAMRCMRCRPPAGRAQRRQFWTHSISSTNSTQQRPRPKRSSWRYMTTSHGRGSAARAP